MDSQARDEGRSSAHCFECSKTEERSFCTLRRSLQFGMVSMFALECDSDTDRQIWRERGRRGELVVAGSGPVDVEALAAEVGRDRPDHEVARGEGAEQDRQQDHDGDRREQPVLRDLVTARRPPHVGDSCTSARSPQRCFGSPPSSTDRQLRAGGRRRDCDTGLCRASVFGEVDSAADQFRVGLADAAQQLTQLLSQGFRRKPLDLTGGA
jgi:hypothetical protein